MTGVLDRDAAMLSREEATGIPSSAAAQRVVRVEGLTKRFRPRRRVRELLRRAPIAPPLVALDGVSFDVGGGEIVGLLGPNGAGKTTLFRILSTLVLPCDGSASVGGADVVRDSAAVRRELGMVPSDERTLHWRLTALENVRLWGALHGVPSAEQSARAADVLETVGLSRDDRRLVGALSSGMRQRLLIARALVSRPRVLLLDEPTRSLDPLSAAALRAFIRDELATRRCCTILLATHDTEEAFRLCDRVVVLHRGRILAEGIAAELARRVGGERVSVLTADPEHPVWTALEQRGVVRRIATAAAGAEGWFRVVCAVSGDAGRRADLLAQLVAAGVRVAALERADSSLATLMSGVIDAAREPSGDA